MAEMMKQMESLAENGEFENVLEGMMQQLMSKELLYEPMKDLAARVSGLKGGTSAKDGQGLTFPLLFFCCSIPPGWRTTRTN